MFDISLVIGAVLMLTEALKRILKRRWRHLDPAVPIVIAVVLGACLNIANAWLFSPAVTVEVVKAAMREGILAAGAAMGMWSGGKAYYTKVVGKSAA